MNLSNLDLIRLFLAVMTCYRLARLIAKDDGPLFLFKRVRYWAKDKAWIEARDSNAITGLTTKTSHGEIDDRYYGKWHSLAEGLECPYCLGVWFSIPLLGLVLVPSYCGDIFLILMTISGMQAWLWAMVNK